MCQNLAIFTSLSVPTPAECFYIFWYFFSLKCTLPRLKEKPARHFLLSKYFLRNGFQNRLSKFEDNNAMQNEYLIIRKSGYFLCSSLLQMCMQSLKYAALAVFVLKFIGVFSTQKSLLNKISLTLKTATSNVL